uniref:Uncharacterized protein n=1 Tax=Timema shepardi TaxID=629360 RepID=A0A7R9AT19_TIMSH|nr:unnamed protein product [Timema shepardi]
MVQGANLVVDLTADDGELEARISHQRSHGTTVAKKYLVFVIEAIFLKWSSSMMRYGHLPVANFLTALGHIVEVDSFLGQDSASSASIKSSNASTFPSFTSQPLGEFAQARPSETLSTGAQPLRYSTPTPDVPAYSPLLTSVVKTPSITPTRPSPVQTPGSLTSQPSSVTQYVNKVFPPTQPLVSTYPTRTSPGLIPQPPSVPSSTESLSTVSFAVSSTSGQFFNPSEVNIETSAGYFATRQNPSLTSLKSAEEDITTLASKPLQETVAPFSQGLPSSAATPPVARVAPLGGSSNTYRLGNKKKLVYAQPPGLSRSSAPPLLSSPTPFVSPAPPLLSSPTPFVSPAPPLLSSPTPSVSPALQLLPSSIPLSDSTTNVRAFQPSALGGDSAIIAATMTPTQLPTSEILKYQPSVQTESQSSLTVLPPSFSNLSQGQAGMMYREVYHHWFFKKEVEGKVLWQPFSMVDSLALEEAFTSS